MTVCGRIFRVLMGSALMLTAPAVFPAGDSRIEALIASGEHRAARRELTERLQAEPDDVAARFQRARVAGFLGDYAAALDDYDRLVARYTDNVDYVFGRAQALAWLNRDSEALEALDRAVQLAPDYEAVWRLRLAVTARLPGAAEDGRLDALREDARARFPASTWWSAPARPAVRNWTLIAGGAVESLSGGLPGWNNQFAELQWRQSDAASYQARLARANRFDVADIQFGLGAEYQLDERWYAGMSVAGGADAEFVAGRSFGAHLGRRFDDGWSIDLRLGYREFEAATVGSYAIATEKYFGDFRAAYTLSLTHLYGATDSIGHVASLTWYATGRHSYRLTVASGEEAEAIAPGQVLETDVSGVSVGGRHRLTDRLSLDWWAGTHEQGDFYRRDFVGLAASVGF